MKILNKRSLAWLSSVLMLISIFASVIVLPAEAATVDYVYSGSYVYNWGTREEVATFTTPMAEAWYDKNNTSYEELSALSGSSNQSSVPSSALYKELQSLMKSNHKNETSYSETKSLFQYTDCQNNGGKISSFYSGKAIGPTWDGGWNREHTWPNSKGDASGNGENDIMMLRPTSTSENSSRGNKAYGESSGYYNPNSESGGKYDLRGDVARIMLFVYCRWGNTGKMWGSAGVMESLPILLKWVEQDPVDTWELGRNDSTQSITGTRNVFVDYPELIFTLFGTAVPADYQSPSGNGSAVSYDITATVNNSAYGSVSVSGKNVTATPKDGYAVSGYTILSGTATVVRNGNVFVVDADSDVSIRINFAARQQVSVQYVEDGAVANTQTVYSGDAVTLPAHSGALPEGYTFVGWVEDELEDTTNIPTFYKAGTQYTVGAATMLYALYSRSEKGGDGTSNVFEPYSGALTEGDYLVTYEGVAMVGANTGKNRLQWTDITVTNGNVVAPAADAIWHFAPNGNYWTMYNVASSAYAAGTGTKNTAKLDSSLTDHGKWTATVLSNTYEFTNLGNDAAGVNPMLRYNSGIGFACYAKNTNVGGALTLYKRAGGSTYYFTNSGDPCQHDYQSVETEVPTCGQEGVLTHTCSICGRSYTELIPATGLHVYEDAYDEECDECGDLRQVPERPAYVPGDINGDGSVNNRDLAALQKYLNEWSVTVVVVACDTNGDGSVNNRDLALLQKYLNEWDVTLH